MVQLMASNVLLGILFSLLLQISVGHRRNKLPKFEDLGKVNQFEHLNKPAVKTIKTDSGDVYECVDFYKQPAFDHPALKNHNFHPQMRPSYRIQKISSAHTSPKDVKSASVGLKDKACPVGTVPIRRVYDDYLTQIKPLMNNHTLSLDPDSIPLEDNTYVAIAQTRTGDRQVYHGVGANLSVHNTPVFSYEYSSGQIGIERGGDSIQAGWTVNPILYKDTITRMFIYTNAGQSHCFNTNCPGFVIVRTDMPVDSIIAPVSGVGGTIYELGFFIYQDPMNGNWWLEVGADDTPIGFWPKGIFTGLAESGSYIECGGESCRQSSILGVPNMGSGFKPSKHFNYNAYCFNFFVVDESGKQAIKIRTEGYSSGPSFYGIQDKFVMKSLHHVDGIIGSENRDELVNATNIVIDVEHRVVYGGIQNYPSAP